jgi:hypothetical protein
MNTVTAIAPVITAAAGLAGDAPRAAPDRAGKTRESLSEGGVRPRQPSWYCDRS